MAVGFSNTNKPINPRGKDASPLAYNRAKLYSGKALDFDGVNDYVTFDGFAGTLSNNDAWTACGYFKTDSNTRATWFSAHNVSSANIIRVGVEANKDGLFYADIYTGDVQIGNFDFKDDKWHFVALSREQGGNGSLLTLYVDGVELTSLGTGIDWNTATQFSLGQEWDYNGASDFWNGLLSNFKIFNTALTAAQVADLYNNPEKVVPTGVDNTALKLWLPMMEGAGTTAYDGSGNGNHGTISGATYVNGVGSPVAQSAVMDWNKGSNLVTYSEQFDNAYWGVIAMNSIVANDTTAPDGQNTADKITPNATTNIHYIYSTSNFLTGQNTISVFAKHNGYSIGFRPQGIGSNKSFVNFDLQNGVILSTGGTDYNDSSITSFGDGWYRCSMTMTNAGSYGLNFYAIEDGETTEVPNFTADGTSGFYLWGAQGNAGATLTPYVRTGATAQTSPVLLPQGLTSGRDITGVNLFENVRKQGALNLDGNSWAEVHDNASIDLSDANASFEAWVYHVDTGVVSQYIMNKFDGTTGVRIRTETGNNFGFYASDGTNNIADSGTKALTANAWNHIVLTTDGTNFKRYINGALVDTDVAGTPLTTFANADSLYIGSEQTNASLTQSRIAQPRIYNRALTAAEIQQNYNSGKNTYK